MGDLTIVVAGCVAAQEGQQLLRRVPEVDLVMGECVGIERWTSAVRVRENTDTDETVPRSSTERVQFWLHARWLSCCSYVDIRKSVVAQNW